jgi:Rrf2 family iron-sulfur cluster assembly transcriptional regulator
MLSNTCKYGIRAIIYLALEDSGKKIGIKKISEDLDIPSPFLSKILQRLAKNKILQSTKGPHGGFGLGRDGEDISLMDIVRIIDGMDFFERCLIGLKSCLNPDSPVRCPIHQQYEPIREETRKLFEDTTIAQLSESIKNSGGDLRI